jgi:hypothetical protein
VYGSRKLTYSPPFASQASAMSQSSSTTYSTGTGSTSSATTVTSPGTSKGSWGDMMTSTNTGLVNQARPLPIPEGQSGKLDPVSLISSNTIITHSSHASHQVTAFDQHPSQCQLPQVRISNRSRPGSTRSTISRIQRDTTRHSPRKGEREGK